jgi:hypothetical protein
MRTDGEGTNLSRPVGHGSPANRLWERGSVRPPLLVGPGAAGMMQYEFMAQLRSGALVPVVANDLLSLLMKGFNKSRSAVEQIDVWLQVSEERMPSKYRML